MGLNFGGTSTNSTASGSTAGTYSPAQSSLQNSLMQALSQLLPATANGSVSPNVANMETANASQINQQYNGMGDQMNRYLAARGFGQSGQTGQAAEQTNLAREGALASNTSAASGQQLGLDSTLLSDSLSAAFQQIGNTSQGTTAGSSSGWGAGLSVGGAIPGLPTGFGA